MTNPSFRPAPKAVAVVRFGAAGDVILAAPIIAALARAWPQSRIIMVTHERLSPLLSGNPDLTDVVALAPGAKVRSLVAPLRALGVTAVCDLHSSWRSRALTFLLRPNRSSRFVKRTWHEWAAHHLAHAPYRPQRPLPQRYHRAAEALVGRPLPRESLHYVATEAHRREAAQLLRASGASYGVVTVALLPGAAWATKRWPVAHFAEIARRLRGRGVQVLLIGSAAEAPLTQAIAAAAPGCIDLGGAAGLGALGGILATCAAVVAGDTGPMHMARGLGVPCIALFGSTPASQFELPTNVAMKLPLHCSPCSFYGRPACPRGHLHCMTQLSPSLIWPHLALHVDTAQAARA